MRNTDNKMTALLLIALVAYVFWHAQYSLLLGLVLLAVVLWLLDQFK